MGRVVIFNTRSNVVKKDFLNFKIYILIKKGNKNMLQIADNSRQIPKDKIYLKNTTYHDYLYGYLQSKAHWDGVVGHPRVVPKKEVNFS